VTIENNCIPSRARQVRAEGAEKIIQFNQNKSGGQNSKSMLVAVMRARNAMLKWGPGAEPLVMRTGAKPPEADDISTSDSRK